MSTRNPAQTNVIMNLGTFDAVNTVSLCIIRMKFSKLHHIIWSIFYDSYHTNHKSTTDIEYNVIPNIFQFLDPT